MENGLHGQNGPPVQLFAGEVPQNVQGIAPILRPLLMAKIAQEIVLIRHLATINHVDMV